MTTLSRVPLCWWFFLISVIINVFFGLFEPYVFYDSLKYYLSGTAIASGEFQAQDLLVENTRGYPFLVALSIYLADYFDIIFVAVLSWIQVFFGICIDLFIYFTVLRLIAVPKIAFLSAIFSVFSIESKMFLVAVMTEIPYLFLLSGSFLLFCMGMVKRFSIFLPLAIVASVIAGFIRPFGLTVGAIYCLVWLLKDFFGPPLCGDKVSKNRLARPQYFSFLLIIYFISVSTVVFVDKKPEIGFHEKISVIWISTISFNDEFYQKFRATEKFKEYKKDFVAWLDRRERPPLTKLDPFWRSDTAWDQFYQKGGSIKEEMLRQWIVPRWVLMTQRNYSLAESLRWQTDVCLELISSSPELFLYQLKEEVSYSLILPPRGAKRALNALAKLPETNFRLFQMRFLELVNDYHAALFRPINSWWTRPITYWYVLLFLGMFAGFFVYKRWEYLALVAVILSYCIVTPSLAGALARYRMPLEVFSGVFIIGLIYPTYLTIKSFIMK